MMGQLVTLPLRLTVRSASLALRVSEEVLKRALALTGRSVQAERRYDIDGSAEEIFERERGAGRERDGDREPKPDREQESAEAEPETSSPQQREHAEPRQQAAAVTSREREPEPQPEPTPLVEEPAHVSEEPTIVEELAEPGAEDGAGAEIRIDEPWPGYARMNAKEVIARLSEADAAELAAINLYESANQGRQTVLSAVERQLQSATRGGTSN